jgi:hypothetical protein
VTSDELSRALARISENYAPNGRANQQTWDCEDGWYVIYTTSRVEGGPDDGKFLAMAYKPVGKGSRTGQAAEWVCVYRRAFARRNKAKERAVELYCQHSPKWAERHGKGKG